MLRKEDLIEKTTTVFEENGVYIDDKQAVKDMDSLQYIGVLIGLEKEFDIEFPDALLVRNIFINMDDFYEILCFLLGDKCQ